ncbi:hypothetical protein FRC12_001085 [Ceratobasidium sp. 428]|nr:hypothetical protein FRC12_001085 [Ceratobasidium sp. 428]
MFDAGDHRIYRYAYKDDPDVSVLPEYGDAQPGECDDFWYTSLAVGFNWAT